MRLLTIEHSPAAYRADFLLYGAATVAGSAELLLAHPVGSGGALLGWVLGGLALWTLVEYLLHRFVLHGLPPFRQWHAAHHQRPLALISSPTVLSASLFALLAVLPSWFLLGPWPGAALSLGLMAGYLGYSLMHHALHHGAPLPARLQPWLARSRHRHALHHSGGLPAHYGVSFSLWDRVFGTRALAARRGLQR